MRSKRVELILDTARAVRGAKDLSKATDDVAGSLADTAREGDRAGRAVDSTGEQMSEAARAAAKLDREIEELTGSLRELAIAQTLTGNDFSKQIREQEQQVRRLGRNRKLFGDLGADAAPEFALSFSQRLGPLMARLPISGPMAQFGAAAGAAAAPLLGAAISGAIIGGVGIGGVAGGFALAAKDERVKAAIEGLGDGIEARLEGAAGSFVQPALQSVKEVQQAINTVDFEAIFRNSARYVPVLTGGITSAITDLGDGIEKLVANAGPAISVISGGIALIGESLGSGLGALSDNGDSSARAMAQLFQVVDMGVDSVLGLVNMLTELYEIGEKVNADMVLDGIIKLHQLATGSDAAAESSKKLGNESAGAGEKIRKSGEDAEATKARQQALTEQQKALTAAQNAYNTSLDQLAPKAGFAAQVTEGLRRAAQGMFGAAIAGAEANEAYQASVDGLTSSVEANGRSLSINTAKGRANRDSLQALLGASNEMYYANIAQGQSTEQASAKHAKRTEQVRKEARQLGLNKVETDKLISTYGRIPGRKATDLVVEGLNQIMIELRRVYLAQRALAEGKTINQVRYEGTAAMRSITRANGGIVRGPGTGTSDSINARLSDFEYVVNAKSTRKVGVQTLDHINRYGELPQFAAGGFYAPVETSRRMHFPVNVRGAYVMPREEALSKVRPPVPTGGPTSDWIVRTAKTLVDGLRVLSKDRPGSRTLSGNVSYHALGRAVDFNPSRELARKWDAMYRARTKELISPFQQYNIHNGRRHRYTGAVWNQHNFAGGNPHDHIAMANGGVIREPVFGVGRSGRTYSFAENGRPERVLPGGSGGGGTTVTINAPITIQGDTRSPEQVARSVSRHIGREVDIILRGVS